MSVISHICHLAHLITQPVCTFVTHMGSIGLYGYWQIIWATYGYHRPSTYGRFACGPYGTREHTFLANSSASFEFLEMIAKKKKKIFFTALLWISNTSAVLFVSTKMTRYLFWYSCCIWVKYFLYLYFGVLSNLWCITCTNTCVYIYDVIYLCRVDPGESVYTVN